MDLNGQEKKFLGQGWRYPMGVDGRGGIAMTRRKDDIDASIKVILATAKGERVMRPEFGSSIHDVVFAPNNPTTHGLIASPRRPEISASAAPGGSPQSRTRRRRSPCPPTRFGPP